MIWALKILPNNEETKCLTSCVEHHQESPSLLFWHLRGVFLLIHISEPLAVAQTTLIVPISEYSVACVRWLGEGAYPRV